MTQDSKTVLPPGIKTTQITYDDDGESLISALHNQQILIITLSVRAPPDIHSKLTNAAAKAGVPYIMPNVYGSDILNPTLCAEDLYGAGSIQRCAEIENLGLSYIAMVCGFWYEWSLAGGELCFGFDIKNRKATFFDDGNTYINVSTWQQCGRAVAGLLSLPESGAKLSVAMWKNRPFYVSSFRVCQRGMLDSIHRVIGTTDEEWEIVYEDSARRYRNALGQLEKGDRLGFVKAMYTRVFFPNGGGDYESSRGLANELVGLSKEDLDEATKRAVERAESS